MALSEYPKVAIRLAGSGTGNPPAVGNAGAWMQFEVFDEGERRYRPSRGVLAVTFKAIDERGTEWTTESRYVREGILLTVPSGYARTPKNLQIEASAGGQLLGLWMAPRLAEKRRVLTRQDWTPRPAATVAREGDNLRMSIHTTLAGDEMWQMKLVAHSFDQVQEPHEAEISVGGRSAVFINPVNGGLEGVEEVQLAIRKVRSYAVTRTVELPDSYVVRIDGQPTLRAKPNRVPLVPDVSVMLRSAYTPPQEGKTNRTMLVNVESDARFQTISTQVLEPSAERRGLCVSLAGGVGLHTDRAVFRNPAKLPPLSGFEFKEGRFPLKLRIEARPYRQFAEETIVVPVKG